jgi:DNA-binding GntR family transcriptional regulator
MDDELIRVAGLATRVACQRMTPCYLKALSDSIEQVCCVPATFAWDRKATAYAEIVNILADAAADPVLTLLVRNLPGHTRRRRRRAGDGAAPRGPVLDSGARASRLSVDPDNQVLLLEYGGGDTNPMLQANVSGPG